MQYILIFILDRYDSLRDMKMEVNALALLTCAYNYGFLTINVFQVLDVEVSCFPQCSPELVVLGKAEPVHQWTGYFVVKEDDDGAVWDFSAEFTCFFILKPTPIWNEFCRVQVR